eukprot:TRINITY_DN5897_c0_g1_i1.p1 TRINITY_DN5897_c0_g1~~TRINITY_DN5897_c0_g1_i1.p1  ORF type:complete len:1986 (+),score=484.81 TRINITY_DN5897_c0_g1_i1:21-5978(+)
MDVHVLEDLNNAGSVKEKQEGLKLLDDQLAIPRVIQQLDEATIAELHGNAPSGPTWTHVMQSVLVVADSARLKKTLVAAVVHTLKRTLKLADERPPHKLYNILPKLFDHIASVFQDDEWNRQCGSEYVSIFVDVCQVPGYTSLLRMSHFKELLSFFMHNTTAGASHTLVKKERGISISHAFDPLYNARAIHNMICTYPYDLHDTLPGLFSFFQSFFASQTTAKDTQMKVAEKLMATLNHVLLSTYASNYGNETRELLTVMHPYIMRQWSSGPSAGQSAMKDLFITFYRVQLRIHVSFRGRIMPMSGALEVLDAIVKDISANQAYTMARKHARADRYKTPTLDQHTHDRLDLAADLFVRLVRAAPPANGDGVAVPAIPDAPDAPPDISPMKRSHSGDTPLGTHDNASKRRRVMNPTWEAFTDEIRPERAASPSIIGWVQLLHTLATKHADAIPANDRVVLVDSLVCIMDRVKERPDLELWVLETLTALCPLQQTPASPSNTSASWSGVWSCILRRGPFLSEWALERALRLMRRMLDSRVADVQTVASPASQEALWKLPPFQPAAGYSRGAVEVIIAFLRGHDLTEDRAVIKNMVAYEEAQQGRSVLWMKEGERGQDHYPHRERLLEWLFASSELPDMDKVRVSSSLPGSGLGEEPDVALVAYAIRMLTLAGCPRGYLCSPEGHALSPKHILEWSAAELAPEGDAHPSSSSSSSPPEAHTGRSGHEAILHTDERMAELSKLRPYYDPCEVCPILPPSQASSTHPPRMPAPHPSHDRDSSATNHMPSVLQRHMIATCRSMIQKRSASLLTRVKEVMQNKRKTLGVDKPKLGQALTALIHHAHVTLLAHTLALGLRAGSVQPSRPQRLARGGSSLGPAPSPLQVVNPSEDDITQVVVSTLQAIADTFEVIGQCNDGKTFASFLSQVEPFLASLMHNRFHTLVHSSIHLRKTIEHIQSFLATHIRGHTKGGAGKKAAQPTDSDSFDLDNDIIMMENAAPLSSSSSSSFSSSSSGFNSSSATESERLQDQPLVLCIRAMGHLHMCPACTPATRVEAAQTLLDILEQAPSSLSPLSDLCVSIMHLLGILPRPPTPLLPPIPCPDLYTCIIRLLKILTHATTVKTIAHDTNVRSWILTTLTSICQHIQTIQGTPPLDYTGRDRTSKGDDQGGEQDGCLDLPSELAESVHTLLATYSKLMKTRKLCFSNRIQFADVVLSSLRLKSSDDGAGEVLQRVVDEQGEVLQGMIQDADIRVRLRVAVVLQVFFALFQDEVVVWQDLKQLLASPENIARLKGAFRLSGPDVVKQEQIETDATEGDHPPGQEGLVSEEVAFTTFTTYAEVACVSSPNRKHILLDLAIFASSGSTDSSRSLDSPVREMATLAFEHVAWRLGYPSVNALVDDHMDLFLGEYISKLMIISHFPMHLAGFDSLVPFLQRYVDVLLPRLALLQDHKALTTVADKLGRAPRDLIESHFPSIFAAVYPMYSLSGKSRATDAIVQNFLYKFMHDGEINNLINRSCGDIIMRLLDAVVFPSARDTSPGEPPSYTTDPVRDILQRTAKGFKIHIPKLIFWSPNSDRLQSILLHLNERFRDAHRSEEKVRIFRAFEFLLQLLEDYVFKPASLRDIIATLLRMAGAQQPDARDADIFVPLACNTLESLVLASQKEAESTTMMSRHVGAIISGLMTCVEARPSSKSTGTVLGLFRVLFQSPPFLDVVRTLDPLPDTPVFSELNSIHRQMRGDVSLQQELQFLHQRVQRAHPAGQEVSQKLGLPRLRHLRHLLHTRTGELAALRRTKDGDAIIQSTIWLVIRSECIPHGPDTDPLAVEVAGQCLGMLGPLNPDAPFTMGDVMARPRQPVAPVSSSSGASSKSSRGTAPAYVPPDFNQYMLDAKIQILAHLSTYTCHPDVGVARLSSACLKTLLRTPSANQAYTRISDVQLKDNLLPFTPNSKKDGAPSTTPPPSNTIITPPPHNPTHSSTHLTCGSPKDEDTQSG